jgi:peroxiredoxin
MIELPRHPKYNLPAKRWCSASYGRERLFQALSTYELWDETVALCHGMHLEPTEVEEEEVKRLRCLGTAYVRRGDLENGVAQLLELEERRARLAAERERAGREAEERERKAIEAGKVDATASPPQAGSAASGAASAGSDDEKARVDKAVAEARRPFDERVGRLERAMEEIEGHLAVADGALAAGLELLRKAGGVDALYLARLELELEQSRQGGADDEQVGKVLEKAREHVVKRPNEVQPLACFAALLWRAGREREASIAFEDLRALSESIDLESGSPVFARVAPIAAAVELPADWRVRRPPRHDVGDRLDFEALGPFRWQPAPAPAWTLADAFGRTRSLADYRGRPLVVIFYLGFGCLHCAEQIGIFAARAGSFAAAGISLVAVSTDRQADLGKAVKDFSAQSSVQELAFPLVADPALEVFKAYRAYDDFERQPLHGTFLIDGAGLVRWQDISFEPFKDAEFVLREACRLLGRAPPAPERRKL